jgi:hypothetical protein
MKQFADRLLRAKFYVYKGMSRNVVHIFLLKLRKG